MFADSGTKNMFLLGKLQENLSVLKTDVTQTMVRQKSGNGWIHWVIDNIYGVRL